MLISSKVATPLYYQVKEKLKKKIQQGKFMPGARLNSEYELMKQYNFSRNTARQALTALVNEGYAFRVHGKGTFVTLDVPDQPENRKNSIGFILCNRKFDLPVYAETLRGIDSVARQNRKHLFFTELENFTTKHQLPLMITDRAVDGVVITGLVSQQILDTFDEIKLPYVLIGVMPPDGRKYIVIADHRSDAVLGIEHLLQHGHREIAFINGKSSYLQYRELERGVTQSLKQAVALEHSFVRHCESFSEQEAFEAMLQLLKGQNPVSAVFVANPDMTRGVVKAIERMRLNIPEDISVIGYGNSDDLKRHNPSITLIEPKPFELASLATGILQQVIDGEKDIPKTVMLEATLAKGDSVKNIT
ncbi:MAG: GntR family transcriptional regulator [Victivallaceae bacterium]|nr:GntR family transcriptional regulator [Victivallaceae bacterium]